MKGYVPDDRRLGVATSAPEWYDACWMLVWGCEPVSEGCAHCSAAQVARRLVELRRADPSLLRADAWSGGVELGEPELAAPPWPAGSAIFVAPMGDLFGPRVPDDFIYRALDAMKDHGEYTFLLLTKRVERAVEVLARWGRLPAHVWLGASVENQGRAAARLEPLARADAVKVWANCEPLLGPVSLFRWLWRLDWVAAGPEFGPDARPCDPTWLRFLRDQCLGAGVPLYLKGELDGRRHRDGPKRKLDAGRGRS